MRKILGFGIRVLPAFALALGALGATVAMAAPITPASTATPAKPAAGNQVYMVQMAEPPVVSNEATKPAPGEKIDARSRAVRQYIAYLKTTHKAAMANVGLGGGRKLYSYGYTFNGFAARMNAKQAEKLLKTPGVVAVTRDEMRVLDTSTTPSFLGLTGPGGFYATTGAKGEDVVIGIVDSGIWPEHPSFDGTGYAPLAGWAGTCVTGTQWTAANCNNKLIGARYYNAGFGGDAGVLALFPYEYLSARDADGHGTHTASTSGGNEAVSTAGSVAAAFGAINGMAPRARIASYKVCWGRGGSPAGCWGSDSVAAIEQAIVDGVDVINFSISGTTSNFMDPVETAFRHAAGAGVFVAASAGNSGPTLQTVAHPSPWITTVAAGTHDRALTASLTLGNGAGYSGASSAASAVPSAAMILSSDAVLAGHSVSEANLCYSSKDAGGNALDPAKVTGKIVVCDRGVTDRVNKSLAVQEAGGVGMVLINTSPNSLNPDFHAVPSVHLSDTLRAAVRAYVATATPTGAISAATISAGNAAPNTASFSSRGPSFATGAFDLLKPDIIAPGQDILAGVSPDGYGGQLFGLLSGTSMSSPHIAGIAALFKELHPTWSPMAIKSALMTSAGDVLDGPNTDPQVLWRQGAGHVRPSRAANPGLVFDSGPQDWQGFLCGQGVLILPNCAQITMDGSDLNMASISVGGIPGSQTVKRRVTNVSGAAANYTASYTGMDGYLVEISPASLAIPAGETRSFEVTFTRTTAPVFSGLISDFKAGQLSWTDGVTTVRVPMIVTAAAGSANAPVQVSGMGSLMKYKVNIGYTGSFRATARGLVPAALSTGTASTGSSETFPVVVPAGTTYARFALFDADVVPGSDIDIIVRNPGGAVVGTGFSGSSQEEVNLANPAPGTYTVEVSGFSVPAGTSPFKLNSFVLGSTSANNMTVYAPTSVRAGQQVDVWLTPRGLVSGTRYMGSVVYTGTTGLPAPTLVRVDR